MSTDVLASGWAKVLGGDRKQFNMFIEKMLDGFAYHKIVVDKTGKPVDYVFLEVNHAFEKMTGLKREKIVGKKVTEVLSGIEDDPADWIGVYGRVALTGEPVQFENYAEPLDKYYHVSAYCPEKGYFVALFEDITESKKAEDSLKEDEKRFHSTLDSMIEGCQILGHDWRYIYINSAAERQNRRPNKELLGERYMDMWPGVESTEVFASLKRCMELRIPQTMENFFTFPDYTSGYFDLKINPVPEGIFILSMDITERKKSEEALRESEERLRFHTENTPLAVVEWDSKFVVTRWAGEAEKMFGWTAIETVGNPIMDLNMIYEPDIPIVEKTMKRLTSGETKVVSQNRNITKEGRVIYCTWYNSVLLDTKGKMLSVFSFVEDYTDKVRAEKALEESNRNLENLVEERTKQLKDSERLAAIGATAGMVGHDIRNPLQAITSDVFLAKSELASIPDSEEKTNTLESLTEIETNIDYINKIVQDLQDYARPLNPQKEEADIKSIFDKLLAKNGLPNNIKVNVKVEDAVRKICADPYYINRIMYNLVTNSAQAMPNGGKLSIHVYQEANDVIISIKDTGVGIPKEIKGKMFTPMFTTKSKGQGFGLPVVKRMTESLDGTVTFESEEGNGTTFFIRLPLKKTKLEG